MPIHGSTPFLPPAAQRVTTSAASPRPLAPRRMQLKRLSRKHTHRDVHRYDAAAEVGREAHIDHVAGLLLGRAGDLDGRDRALRVLGLTLFCCLERGPGRHREVDQIALGETPERIRICEQVHVEPGCAAWPPAWPARGGGHALQHRLRYLLRYWLWHLLRHWLLHGLLQGLLHWLHRAVAVRRTTRYQRRGTPGTTKCVATVGYRVLIADAAALKIKYWLHWLMHLLLHLLLH